MSRAAKILDSLIGEQVQSQEEIVEMFRRKDQGAQDALERYLKKRGMFFPGKWSLKASPRDRYYETVLDKGDKFKVKFGRSTVYGKVGRLRDTKKTKYLVDVDIWYENQQGTPWYPVVIVKGASARGESQASRDKIDKGVEKLITFAKKQLGIMVASTDFVYG